MNIIPVSKNFLKLISVFFLLLGFFYISNFNVARATNPPIASATSYLNATPDPCIAAVGSNTCSSSISWHIGTGVTEGVVTVSTDGRSEQVFACGHDSSGNGSSQFPGTNLFSHTARFRLYSASDCQTITSTTPLAEVTLTARHPLPAAHPALGINQSTLAEWYQGVVAGCDLDNNYAACVRLGQSLGLRSIQDAKDVGISYLRVVIAGFGVSTYGQTDDMMNLWRHHPTTYWSHMDQMFSDLNSNGIKIIPSFNWHPTRWAVAGNDTLADLLTNPQSQSYGLLTSYIHDFITKYKNNPAIDMYELGNELNLSADLNSFANQQCSDPQSVFRNYSTNQLIGFQSRLAGVVRNLDPTHYIDSGDALPRAAAEHLRASPEWIAPNWTADSQSQFEKNLSDVHQGSDVVSVHFYNSDNERLGNTGHMNANFLNIINQAASSTNKPLYVGEFGDVNPGNYNTITHSEDLSAMFSRNVMQLIRSLNIPFSSPWVWERYWSAPIRFEQTFERAYTPVNVSAMAHTNSYFQNPVPVDQIPDVTPPHLVLTSPVGNTVLPGSVFLSAVASDNNSTGINRVEFYINNLLKRSITTPPYQCVLDATHIAPGRTTITAKAFDTSSNSTQYSVQVNKSALPLYELTVTKNGSGKVLSDPAGIYCGASGVIWVCSNSFVSNSLIKLSASPNPGSSFSGWGGACAGNGWVCFVTMSEAKTVTATFNPFVTNTNQLTITTEGTGSGTVISNPTGINCGPKTTCAAAFDQCTPVTLTAVAAQGSRFAGWGGACSGNSSTCSTVVSTDKPVTATFNIP
jgi:Cellulase (glycosyl hydrolase family 5)/Bacterial Ig domain/Divergent InlB B-repeat domain